MKSHLAQQHGSRDGARRRFYVWFPLAVFAVVGAAGGGYWVGQTRATELVASAESISSLEAMIEGERKALEETERESLSYLDAIANRVGEMQAEILRLNALGERLVQMAGLSAEEFDFENPPPVGGPDDSLTRDIGIVDLADELKQVLGVLSDRKRKLTLLEQSIMERDLKEEATPSGLPVLSGYVTSKFGFRMHPIRKQSHFHNGIDFAGKRGSPVIAVADGLVAFSGTKSGYGRMVEIRHMDGLVTRYAHNQENLVAEGDLVKQGQTIATLGSSGSSTGPHVHFEVVKDGATVNPTSYVGASQQQAEG